MIQKMRPTYSRLSPKPLIVAVILAGLIMGGCVRSYRVEIQQGNVISAEQIEKLIPGTSRNEVRFILGTPLIEDPFPASIPPKASR
jgi:outer membrane protein assembly factor BamE